MVYPIELLKPLVSSIILMQFAKLDPNKITPTSLLFDDIYFSSTDAIGESRYHFLIGNQLSERFCTTISKSPKQPFIIGETGFGTGLNFLLVSDLWLSSNQLAKNHTETQLQFISTEKYPIEASRLARIYHEHGWKNRWIMPLLVQYSKISQKSGIQHLQFQIARTTIDLTLLIGDAQAQLERYPFIANAWFLDGFSPSKNPDMWQPTLLEQMAQHSQTGTTFATFTAASHVRKGLQTVGFQVEKTKGFGKKRERLVGKYIGLPTNT